MALNPLLEPGRIVHYPIDFGPPGGVLPHFVILADCRENQYLVFVIKTKPTRWQETNKDAKEHLVAVDKESHPFLNHDSFAYCGELHAIRVFNIVQHVREKPGEIKTKISDKVRVEILRVVQESKLLSEDQKNGIKNYLA